MPWVMSLRDIPAKTQFHPYCLHWALDVSVTYFSPAVTLPYFIYRSVNSSFGAVMSWTIHQNLPSFLAGRLCTFVSYIMCSVFAALQQMGFRFSPEFVKFLITRCDLQNHKHMSVDQFIVVCVQIQKFTGKIKVVGCSLNYSQELVLILGSSTWSTVTAYHTSSNIVILCHALLCTFLSCILEPGGCTWFKIHTSCKCLGS